MASGHDGNAQVDESALVFDAETAVLRDAALGDVQVAEYFNARDDRGVPIFRDGLHGVLQHTVNAVFDGNFRVASFDVDITGATFERGEDDRLNQFDHRTARGVARKPVAGNGLFGVFVDLGHLQGECF